MADKSKPTILVTGAGGKLGSHVAELLRAKMPDARIIATARDIAGETPKRLAKLGIELRPADYEQLASLDAAFRGVDKLLLVSSSEVGKRLPQHRNVIEAAKRASVKLIVYTSILHANISPLGLANEHLQTEKAISASGLPFVVLRNGWYTENYAASIPPALAHGAFLGSAGEGRISSAARADYAEAAVAVLASPENQAGRIYELAGDEAYTLREFAAEIAKQSGKPVIYRNMTEAEFKSALLGAGLPEVFAGLLADSDAGAAKDALFDNGGQLRKLIGHATTPFTRTIADALKS